MTPNCFSRIRTEISANIGFQLFFYVLYYQIARPELSLETYSFFLTFSSYLSRNTISYLLLVFSEILLPFASKRSAKTSRKRKNVVIA